MATERTEPMRAARRLQSDHKRALVLAALDAALAAGRHPSIAGIARRANVGRKFIYDHPDLRADIEHKLAQSISAQSGELIDAARVTGASLRADVENLRAQNQRLTKQVRALEHRLSRAEGAHLLADELLPDQAIAELADRHLAGRVAELDRQVFEAREELRRTTEELEAARSINRELMAEANRQRPCRAEPATTRSARSSDPARRKESS